MIYEDGRIHHKVFMPGPITGRLPEVVHHPENCDENACPIIKALVEWLSGDDVYIAVEGDYFTSDGKSFMRSNFQPRREFLEPTTIEKLMAEAKSQPTRCDDPKAHDPHPLNPVVPDVVCDGTVDLSKAELFGLRYSDPDALRKAVKRGPAKPATLSEAIENFKREFVKVIEPVCLPILRFIKKLIGRGDR